jgi:RNase adaptor protein for sRNA GlmZ degradation
MTEKKVLLILGPRQSGVSSALAACHHYGWATCGRVAIEDVPTLLSNNKGDLAFALDAVPAPELFQAWQADYPTLQGLFLEATVDVLTLRANLSDVPHPNAQAMGGVQIALQADVAELAPLKPLCTFSLNTGELTSEAFRYKMGQILGYSQPKPPGLEVQLVSFGYKYGMPLEANWILDVRFIPNPFYMPELRALTGMDEAIQTYVMGHSEAQAFVTHTAQLIATAMPHYPAQGIDRLIVAIGCTGGKHRSVTLVEQLAGRLKADHPTMALTVVHRQQAGWHGGLKAKSVMGIT